MLCLSPSLPLALSLLWPLAYYGTTSPNPTQVCGLRTGPVPDGSEVAQAFYAPGGEAAAAAEAAATAADGETARLRAAMAAAAAREDYAEAAALQQQLATVGQG